MKDAPSPPPPPPPPLFNTNVGVQKDFSLVLLELLVVFAIKTEAIFKAYGVASEYGSLCLFLFKLFWQMLKNIWNGFPSSLRRFSFLNRFVFPRFLNRTKNSLFTHSCVLISCTLNELSLCKSILLLTSSRLEWVVILNVICDHYFTGMNIPTLRPKPGLRGLSCSVYQSRSNQQHSWQSVSKICLLLKIEYHHDYHHHHHHYHQHHHHHHHLHL